MKKFTSLLIGLSLALAGVAFAQQPEEQASPKKEKAAEKTHGAEAKPGKSEAPAAKQTGAMKETGATTEPGAGKATRLKRPKNLRPQLVRNRMFPVQPAILR